MHSAALLEEIWTGRLQPAHREDLAGLGQILDAFLPVRRLALCHLGAAGRPVLIPDSTEVLQDLPLGDVLAEELGLDVPPGTLVLITGMSDAWAGDTPVLASAMAGEAMGDLAQRLVAWADLPLEQETEALVRLARACQARAARLAGRLPGFDRAAFCEGLATALGGFWAGAATGALTAPLSGADFLDRDEVAAYLRALDPAFSGAATAVMPDLLGQSAPRSRRFEDWAGAVSVALRSHLGAAPTAA